MRLRVLATSLIVLLLSIDASAQSRADRRISTDDQGYRTHPSMVVHAADSANERAFVVWGSTTFDSSGAIVLALYGQQIRASQPVGMPHRLGREDSRILPEVRVLSIGDNFVVLYRDNPYSRRGGTYLQYYDAGADTISAPYWMTELNIGWSSDGIRRLPSVIPAAPHGWRIFWPYDINSNNGLLSVMIDPAGRPVGTAEKVGPIASLPLTYDFLPGLVLLYDPFDFPYEPPTRSRVYYPETDRFDPRIVPNLYNCFHLGRDTSILVFRDSTLRLYPSLFDTSGSEARAIPGLSLWRVDGPRPQGLVTRDSSGRIHLFLTSGHSGGIPGSSFPAYCHIVHIQLDSLQAPMVIDTLLTVRDSLARGSSHSVLAYNRTAGCNNRWQWQIVFGARDGSPGVPYYVELDPSGEIRPIPGPAMPACASVYPISVRQIPSDTSSSIELVTTDTVRLHAPLARTSPPPHRSPVLVSAKGTILIAWHESDTLESDVMRRWFPREDSTGPAFLYQPPPPEHTLPSSAQNISATGSIDNSQHRFAGDLLLHYEQHLDARFRYDPLGTRQLSDGRAFNTRIAFARPGPEGWVGIDTIRIGTPLYSTTRGVFGHVLGYDPDDESFVVLFTEKEMPGREITARSIRGYPASGAEWQGASPWGPGNLQGFVPISPGRYLITDGGRAYFVVGSTPLDTFNLPDGINTSVRYDALRGSRVLASWIASDRLMLATFDTAGTELGRAALGCSEIGCVDSTLDYSIVESAADSSIAVLVGGARGVRMARLGRQLDLRTSDLLVSETDGRVARPAGIFRGDTILAVWEDFREGAPRIYANAYPRYLSLHSGIVDGDEDIGGEDSPRILDPISTAGRDGQLIVYPTPARSGIDVALDMTGLESATIALFNSTGEELMSIQTGRVGGRWFETRIDLSTLTTGVYFLRVRHKDGTIIRQIMKQ